MARAAILGVLRPDGHLDVPRGTLPAKPSRVKLTFLDDVEDEQSALSGVGDYAREVNEYEGLLASGKVRWK